MRPTLRKCALQAVKTASPPQYGTPMRKRACPYERVPVPTGDQSGLLTTQIHEFIDNRHKTEGLGDIFREQIGHVKGLWLSNPNLYQSVFEQEGQHPQSMKPEAWKIYNEETNCKRGLFFMEGSEWHTCQKVIRPTMLSETSARSYGSQLEHLATSLVENWDKTLKVKNLEEELYAYFLEGLMVVTFGRNYDCRSKKQIPRLVNGVRGLFTESAHMTMHDPHAARKHGHAGHSVWRRFQRSMSAALNAGEDIVSENMKKCESGSLCAKLISSGLEFEEIKRILVDLFLAAGDTTSHSMQWSFYLMSQNPEIQSKIAEEAGSVKGCIHSFTSQIPIIKGTIKEALRLYPVAPFITRILPQKSVIGGYEIPKETMVFMSTYSSGRDHRFFQDPLRFWPERWSRNGVRKQTGVCHPLASMPFGHSTRNCVGKHLALTQMYLLLSKVMSSFHVKCDNQDQIKYNMRLLATTSEPVRLSLTRRTEL